MTQSILEGKRILAVDDEQDVLDVLSHEINDACKCTIDTAGSYEKAAELIEQNDYDIVILDIMGVRGFDLLDLAVGRHQRAVMLTAKSLSPEALQKSHDAGARAFLPKDRLGQIVPFLEDVLSHDHKSVWEKILKRMEDYWDERFKDDWRKRFPYYG